ncbi:MAG: GspE/PulE/PilB domain-containing protein, partial [Planctomycetota bacterium]
MNGAATLDNFRFPPVAMTPTGGASDGAVTNTAFERLGDQLLTAGVVTPQQLEEALRRQGDMGLKLGEALIELGFVAEEEILPYIEHRLNVPAVRLRDGVVDPLVVRLIPQNRAEALCALALFRVRNTLCVAMAEPLNLQQVDEIERTTSLRVRAVFANRRSIHRMIQRCYEEGFRVDTVTADLGESAVEISEDAVEVDLQFGENADDSSPIINLVNYLIMQSLRQG